jgi:hypothetical protein
MKLKQTNTITFKLLAVLVMIVTSFSCQDEIPLETFDFESLLVVEATLTDLDEVQEIKLSQTVELNSEESVYIDNASVVVTASNGQNYTFNYSENGVYLSSEAFAVQQDITYTLTINVDGKSYTSATQTLPATAQVDDVYVEQAVKNDIQGLQIFANSTGASDRVNYFRYEYEETYKVIAPSHSPQDIDIQNLDNTVNGFEYDIVVTDREQEERVCYNTVPSFGIRISSTSNVTGASVNNVPIRFIQNTDPIIRERYSILVQQYSQSIEANSFYRILNDFGNLESFLSQNQPGFVVGNITNVDDEDENIVGFFELASYSEKRIFFNYEDFNLTRPDYFFECEEVLLSYNDNSAQDGDLNERNFIIQLVNSDLYTLVNFQFPEVTLVRPECGDCTTIANSNEIPEFWEE